MHSLSLILHSYENVERSNPIYDEAGIDLVTDDDEMLLATDQCETKIS